MQKDNNTKHTTNIKKGLNRSIKFNFRLALTPLSMLFIHWEKKKSERSYDTCGKECVYKYQMKYQSYLYYISCKRDMHTFKSRIAYIIHK